MTTHPVGRDAEVELLREGRPRTALALERREILAEAFVGIAFLAVAVAMGLGLEAERDWHVGHAIVLSALFAIAMRLQLDVGAGYTAPIQLVFVPMLFLLPTPWVPLLVAVSWFLGKLPDYLRREAHPGRAILIPGNAWFAVGPALVLVAGDAQRPDWGDWPVWLLAVVAQIGFDVFFGELREWAGRGIAPRLQLRMLGWIQLIDVLLAPLGLLGAFATDQVEFAFLLLVPPAALLIVFVQERARRISGALRLYETEREAVRSREALIAGASHEVLTHLAVVMGISRHLGRLDDARRGEALVKMERELMQLRHLSRQFVDYTRLKAGRTPSVRVRDTAVREVLDAVAGSFATRAEVTVDCPAELQAVADPDRLEQIAMALVANAVKFSPVGSPVRIAARHAARGTVEIEIVDRGPGIADDDVARLFEELHRGEDVTEGAGIGLYLARSLALAQHGDVRARSVEGDGSTFTISVPAAG